MSRGRRTAAFLGALLGGAGVLHMVRPEHFDRIVPPALPGPARGYTYASGIAELGVAGLLAAPRTRRLGGARRGGAVRRRVPRERADGLRLAARASAEEAARSPYGRLPLQGLLIAQALHVARR
jgi:uncharacterized membrane protein